MIINNTFGFIHIQKTGGTYIRRVMEKAYGEENLLFFAAKIDPYCGNSSPHHTFNETPTEYKHLPMFAFIRNPWDWYVSWFHFFSVLPNIRMAAGQDWLDWWAKNKKKGFKQTVIENIDRYNKQIQNFTNFPNTPPNLALKNFDNLTTETLNYIKTYGNTQRAVDMASRFGVVNKSEHNHYTTYYDKELEQLVRDEYNTIINMFNFTFTK